MSKTIGDGEGNDALLLLMCNSTNNKFMAHSSSSGQKRVSIICVVALNMLLRANASKWIQWARHDFNNLTMQHDSSLGIFITILRQLKGSRITISDRVYFILLMRHATQFQVVRNNLGHEKMP